LRITNLNINEILVDILLFLYSFNQAKKQMLNKKVLIVDDSIISRSGLKNILKTIGVQILEAKDGVEGIEMIQSHKPDLVILDILMPKKTGIEVLEYNKAQNIVINCIMCSADIQETTKTRCLELGAVDFVNKPPKPNVLIQLVQQYLGN
jgi:CheY-like chemotaxis protein